MGVFAKITKLVELGRSLNTNPDWFIGIWIKKTTRINKHGHFSFSFSSIWFVQHSKISIEISTRIIAEWLSCVIVIYMKETFSKKKVGFSLKFLVVTGRCGVASSRFEVLDRKTAFNLFKPCRGLVDGGWPSGYPRGSGASDRSPDHNPNHRNLFRWPTESDRLWIFQFFSINKIRNGC